MARNERIYDETHRVRRFLAILAFLPEDSEMARRLLVFVLLGIVLLFGNLSNVLSDQSYTMPLLGGRWASYVITVQVPTSPGLPHNATISAMDSWNNGQLWFAQMYYPGAPTYTFTQSTNGVVVVEFLDMSNETNVGEAQLSPWPLSGKVIEGAIVKLPTAFGGANFTSPLYMSWLTALAIHEFGHVLGLGHPQIPDIMNGTVNSFFLSTLDLYAVHVLADGQVPDSITLPSNIPFTYVPGSAIPEFPRNFLMVSLAIAFSLLFVRYRKKDLPKSQHNLRTISSDVPVL